MKGNDDDADSSLKKFQIILTHMNSTWEALTFGEDCKTIFKTCDSVLSRLILCCNWFVTLKELNK